MKAIESLWTSVHRQMVKENEFFQKELVHLCYEGKVAAEKNIQNIAQRLSRVKKCATVCFKMEESVLFPYVARHIPRLEPVLRHCGREHQDVVLQLSKMDRWIRIYRDQSSRLVREKLIRQIHDSGVWIVFLLRNHSDLEIRNILEVLKKELKPSEVKELEQEINSHLRSRRRCRLSLMKPTAWQYGTGGDSWKPSTRRMASRVWRLAKS